MSYEGYERIEIAVAGGVVHATVSAPPINVLTLELFGELRRLVQELEADPHARVLVLRSADPDF